MDPASPQVPEGVKIMAAIGHVCLQWARLEMAILGVIVAIEGIPLAKGELIYGGMDMLPRANMAIRLAEYEKLPVRLQKRLRAVRATLNGKTPHDGLAARRNQIVHGAHKDMEGDSTTLTMVRWRGDKREKKFTARDIYQIGHEIFELGDEAWSIFDDFGTWKFGDHRSVDGSGERAEAHTSLWVKITKHFRASFNHRWRRN